MTYADKAHFNNYDPSSFGWPRGGPLVPFAFSGSNFGQCARDVKNVFTCVLTELVPHIPGGINFGAHDDWAYSATDDLAGGAWSFHHYGTAFDLNWNENPMGDYSTNPDAGQRGAIPHDIAHAIALRYGCEYGGDWSGGEGHRGFKDYMHFECHLSPADARSVVLLEDDDMSAADVAAVNAHTDQLVSAINGRLSTIERMISGDTAQEKADFNTIIAKFGLTFRGDPTHPDSLKALHDDLGKILADLDKPSGTTP